MIEVKNLTKYYSGNLAVKNLNFSIAEGEIVGFLGPNGAGKSTTMNIMTGYISSTEGTVTVDGEEILKSPAKTKSKIGYLPEIPPLYPDMTVEEYLKFVCDLKGIKGNKNEYLSGIYQKVKIDDVKSRLIKNLSKGYKQRVGLAQALIGNPKLLIFDEPTVGLDPKQIIEIRNLIKELGKKHTVILSSHVLSEIQAVCDRVLVINKGVIIADDSTDNLTNSSRSKKRIIVTVDNDEKKAKRIFAGIDGVISISKKAENNDGSVDFIIESAEDLRREISKIASANDLIVLGLKVEDVNLEDVFMELVSKEIPDTPIINKANEEITKSNDTDDINDITENIKQDEVSEAEVLLEDKNTSDKDDEKPKKNDTTKEETTDESNI